MTRTVPAAPSESARADAEPQRPSLAATLPPLEMTLLDLADRLLDRGVVLAGDATISVAGVDLVYLGLNAVLSSVDALERAGKLPPTGSTRRRERPDAGEVAQPEPNSPAGPSRGPNRLHPVALSGGVPAAASPAGAGPQGAEPDALLAPLEVARSEVERVQGVLPERVEVDPDGVERGLAKLVLTLVEFIRQLLERQAVRRMEGGGLTEAQVERMGLALQRLEEKVRELCGAFGLDPDELNVDLGPLGDLM